MKRRSMLSLFATPLLFNSCSADPFYFIQMADTQLGMIDNGNDGNNFAVESQLLEDVFAHINAMTPSPAFVTVCGDLTNTPEHASQIKEYKRLTGLLKPSIPVFNVSGNHDFKGNCNTDNLNFYNREIGSDYYCYDFGGWHFVVLNSVLMKFPESYSEAAEAQLDWLQANLLATTNKSGTIVFMHHPFFDNDIDEEDGYHNMPKTERRTILDMFLEYNVKVVFSGHRHTTIPEHDYSGMKLINTNAICNSFDQKPGLRIARIINSEFRQEFVARDDIPSAVDI